MAIGQTLQMKPMVPIMLAPGCLVLENFLYETDRERLQSWLSNSDEIGFHKTSNEYPDDYRNSQRLMVDSQEWAEMWWKRLKPILLSQGEQFRFLRPVGFGSSGGWAPIGINSYFRFCKLVTPYAQRMNC